MPLRTSAYLPTATYRFQLNGSFTFRDLEALVPYLDDLGISDCYFSPIFRAAPGSTHGYDVSDPTLINPELGGAEGFSAVTAALQERSMGCILDFVPNHMGIAGPFNRWWLDVLENGQQSRYARYFDIEWYPRHEALRERILVPMLGDYYGKILEAGQLKLEYADGRFGVRYFESLFPLRPESTIHLLNAIHSFSTADEIGDPDGRLSRVRSLFQLLPEPEKAAASDEYTEREQLLEKGRRELAALAEDPAFGSAIREVIEAFNGKTGEPASFDRLHELLEDQHYRLAFWKTGAHETNYRRFFAIDTLIGLRVEDPAVLRASHALLADLIQAGQVRGVRLDHIDGLWDPMQYLHDFQTFCTHPGPDEVPAFYLVVEKILEHGEALPADWPIHGTTGYEFISQLGGLLIDSSAEASFSETFGQFTGIRLSAADLIYEKKRFVLEELFANAIGNLALGLDQTVEYDRRWRDLTMHDLRVAVREFMACLSVYRTYRSPGSPAGPADAATIRAACDEAKRRNRSLDPVPFDFLRDVMIGDYRENELARTTGRTTEIWTLKLQQATGAVMAKSVEDTAFYVYNRLYALNEVGCDPGRFGDSTDAFHTLNQTRLKETPQSMLTTSTHDTKMSEDVRARIYTLTEEPERWREKINLWAKHNRRFKTDAGEGRLVPDGNEEFFLYQILLGAWPLEGGVGPDFIARIKATLRKAISEAKTNSNWIYPNQRWMEAADHFVESLLDPANGFLDLFVPEAERVAQGGMVNSLAQVTLKLTSPGVPDLYQGNEIWDFSLVDPDNRRPVDFILRQRLASGLANRTPEELLKNWKDGGIKLHLTRTLLRLRKKYPMLFQKGDYEPISAAGPFAERIVAFRRRLEPLTLWVVAPRLAGKVGTPPIGSTWKETALDIDLPKKTTELLSGRQIKSGKNPILSEILAVLPCAVLITEEAS